MKKTLIAVAMLAVILLPATAGAVADYREEILDLEARVAALEQQNTQLRAQISQLQIPVSTGAVDGGQIAQLSARISALEGSVRQLQTTVMAGLQSVIGLLQKAFVK